MQPTLHSEPSQPLPPPTCTLRHTAQAGSPGELEHSVLCLSPGLLPVNSPADVPHQDVGLDPLLWGHAGSVLLGLMAVVMFHADFDKGLVWRTRESGISEGGRLSSWGCTSGLLPPTLFISNLTSPHLLHLLLPLALGVFFSAPCSQPLDWWNSTGSWRRGELPGSTRAPPQGSASAASELASGGCIPRPALPASLSSALSSPFPAGGDQRPGSLSGGPILKADSWE